MSDLITPVDSKVLAEAKERVADELTGKTKGWRGPNHGKTINGIKHVHVQKVGISAGDLCAIAQAVLVANPDKIPEKVMPHQTIFHSNLDAVALAKVKFDAVFGLPSDTPVVIYADEAFHLLETLK